MKYLNKDGLQVVADKINTRLKTVTTMPLTANPGAVRLYVGEDTADYKKGHIYKYNSETYYCYIAEDGGYYYHFYIKEIEAGATVYACGSPEWFQKKADSISELTSDFSEIGYTFSVTAASPSSITISNGGGSIVANRSSDDDLSNVGWIDISAGGGMVDLNFDPASENAQSGIAVSQALRQVVSDNTVVDTWESITWSGFPEPDNRMWNCDDNTYYSYTSQQYVLNKATNTWESKTWNGFSNIISSFIWKDGDNVYYSNGSDQYVLNKSTSTWETKTWNGLTSFNGDNIWTDGNNVYYSHWDVQYVLDKETDNWEPKTWTSLTNLYGCWIWQDEDKIYYSSDTSQQYVLNKITMEWEPKTWYGVTSPERGYIWTDGTDFYYSDTYNNYVLNKSTDTWEPKTWYGITEFYGNDIWSDGTNIYYSSSSDQFKLTRTTK